MITTQDKFLDGRLVIAQPKHGYRAGVDPVLLAAACTAQSGETVLELGIGVGVASLCLAQRVPDLKLHGVEIQAEYAGLATRNATKAGICLEVAIANIGDDPSDFGDRQFHHILMNPPFFTDAGHKAADIGRATGRTEETPLSDWLSFASKRLRPKGTLNIVQRMERLPDVLSGMSKSIGSIKVQPLAGRLTKSPNLFLLQAIKNGRAPFEMLPSLAMHEGDAHIKDMESYTGLIKQVLRDGMALPCFR